MRYGSGVLAGSVMGALLAGGALRAEGPMDLQSAFETAFSGVHACVALRDVGPGAQAAVSDEKTCAKALPPCDTFELAASVVAIDRGVVADPNTPVKRTPPVEGDPPNGVNLRDAFSKSTPWVFEEVSRRIGADVFSKALGSMRYGNAQTKGPVEKIGKGEDSNGLSLKPVEQAEFLARLKRGELPTSAESQARTVEMMGGERVGETTLALKRGACDGVAWAVGWVDRGQRSTTFAVAETGQGISQDDTAARTRKLLEALGLLPAPQQ